MTDILKNKIFLAIKNKRPEEESKGNIIGFLSEGYYLVRFLQWEIKTEDNIITMSSGNEPIERIIHLKNMKEWLFFSNEKEFKREAEYNVIIRNYLNMES